LLKWFALFLQPFFQPLPAIAMTACLRFGAILVPAVFPVVRVFDAEPLKPFLPTGPLPGQRRGAKTGLDPVRHPLVTGARLLHIPGVLVTGN
jgi:hypothetical protein